MGQLILFFVAVFFAFFIPGTLIIYPLKLNFRLTATVGIILGISFWSLQGYFFGILGLRWLTYFYLGITASLWVLIHGSKFEIPKKIVFPKKIDYILVIIIILGVFLNLSSVWIWE